MSMTTSLLKGKLNPERIKPAEESETSKYLMACIYGMPWTGKTTLAAQAPDPILVDIEGGAKVLKDPPTGLESLKQVRVFRPTSEEELDDFFWDVRGGKIQCKTVIYDTFTELQAINLDGIRKKENVETNSQPQYNRSTNVMRKHLISFRETPVNFIVICHADQATDKIDQVELVRPAVTPKVATNIHSLMDVIAYCSLEHKAIQGKLGQTEINRIVRTIPTRRIVAKNRIGLEPVYSNPTWQTIFGDRYNGSD